MPCTTQTIVLTASSDHSSSHNQQSSFLVIRRETQFRLIGELHNVEKNQAFDDITWCLTGWQSLQLSFLPEGFVKMLTAGDMFSMNSRQKT